MRRDPPPGRFFRTAAKAADRYVRREATVLDGRAGAPASVFNLLLQKVQRRIRGDARPNRATRPLAEASGAAKLKIETRRIDAAERRIDVLQEARIDIAKKRQRQVKIVERDPARAFKSRLQIHEGVADIVRDRKTDKDASQRRLLSFGGVGGVSGVSGVGDVRYGHRRFGRFGRRPIERPWTDKCEAAPHL